MAGPLVVLREPELGERVRCPLAPSLSGGWGGGRPLGHPTGVGDRAALGFTIPYLHSGGAHEYVPDFIALLDNGIHLILEPKGHDQLKEVKVQAAERWVSAVNAEGRYGEWRYAVTEDMNAIPALLDGLASAGVAA